MLNIFNAFMAYQHFVKRKEEAEKAALEEGRKLDALLEEMEREHQVEEQILEMECGLFDAVFSMTCLYEEVAIDSGFYEQVTESNQMLKDLWIYSIATCVSASWLPDFEQEELIQYLLDQCDVDNPVSASEHLSNMSCNFEYEAYMRNCFEGDMVSPGIFWIFLSIMGGNNDEIIKNTIEFTKEYSDFMCLLDQYLAYSHPNYGFGNTAQTLVNDMLEKTSQFFENEEAMEKYQVPSIINPLVPEEY